MSARDDYPINRTDTTVTYWIDPRVWKDMCDEIDRLREANASLARISGDHLPIIHIHDEAVLKINGRWMLVKNEPKEPT